MSMMRCNCCGNYIDTDYNAEGEWDVPVKGSDKKKDFVCGSCCEEFLTEDGVFDEDLPADRAMRDRGDAIAAMAGDKENAG